MHSPNSPNQVKRKLFQCKNDVYRLTKRRLQFGEFVLGKFDYSKNVLIAHDSTNQQVYLKGFYPRWSEVIKYAESGIGLKKTLSYQKNAIPNTINVYGEGGNSCLQATLANRLPWGIADTLYCNTANQQEKYLAPMCPDIKFLQLNACDDYVTATGTRKLYAMQPWNDARLMCYEHMKKQFHEVSVYFSESHVNTLSLLNKFLVEDNTLIQNQVIICPWLASESSKIKPFCEQHGSSFFQMPYVTEHNWKYMLQTDCARLSKMTQEYHSLQLKSGQQVSIVLLAAELIDTASFLHLLTLFKQQKCNKLHVIGQFMAIPCMFSMGTPFNWQIKDYYPIRPNRDQCKMLTTLLAAHELPLRNVECFKSEQEFKNKKPIEHRNLQQLFTGEPRIFQADIMTRQIKQIDFYETKSITLKTIAKHLKSIVSAISNASYAMQIAQENSKHQPIQVQRDMRHSHSAILEYTGALTKESPEIQVKMINTVCCTNPRYNDGLPSLDGLTNNPSACAAAPAVPCTAAPTKQSAYSLSASDIQHLQVIILFALPANAHAKKKLPETQNLKDLAISTRLVPYLNLATTTTKCLFLDECRSVYELYNILRGMALKSSYKLYVIAKFDIFDKLNLKPFFYRLQHNGLINPSRRK